VGALNAWNRSN
jgi:hypothetical protein